VLAGPLTANSKRRMKTFESDLHARNALVAELVALLAAGDFEEALRRAPHSRVNAEQLRQAVCEYGRTLTPLPADSHVLIDYVAVHDSAPQGWSAVVPLFTQEEGRSDLSLELSMSGLASGGHHIEINDIHVL